MTKPVPASKGIYGRGHHDKPRLHGLFLPSVESDALFDGRSAGAAWKAHGKESFWKRTRALMQAAAADPQRAVPPQYLRSFATLMGELPATPVRDEILRLAAAYRPGEPPPVIPPEIAGPWSGLRAMAGDELTAGTMARLDHYVEVECASARAVEAAQPIGYRRLAALVAADADLQPYWNATALDWLAFSLTEAQSEAPRSAAFLEFMLSHIARMDVVTRGDGDHDDIAALLDAPATRPVEPGAALIRRLQMAFGVRKRTALVALDGRDDFVDERTVTRWASADSFPSNETLGGFLDAALLSAKADAHLALRIDRLHWAAQRLHYLMATLRQPGLASFHHDNLGPDAWARTRYEFWRGHWAARDLETQRVPLRLAAS